MFPTAEAAWLWTCAVLRAREEGRAGPPGLCSIDAVLRGLDRLYRNRRLDLLHVRVLRRWGFRGRAPHATRPADGHDYAVWTEALQRLEWVWRQAGIISQPVPSALPAGDGAHPRP